jgi:endonuclease/exonuclease/phosphatase (EEP) superfamily protein YafD
MRLNRSNSSAPFARNLGWVCATFLLGVTTVSFFDWPGPLFTPFLPQIVVVALLLLLTMWRLKAGASVFIVLLVVSINAGRIGYRLSEIEPLPSQAAGVETRLIFSNLLVSNVDYDRLIGQIDIQKPHILAVTETTSGWTQRLSALSAYPYQYSPPEGINVGAVYAQQPFHAEQILLKGARIYVTRAQFARFVLFVAHPPPPESRNSSETNASYLAELASFTSKETLPVLVVGDLNATLWSKSFQPLLDAGLKPSVNTGFLQTWPTSVPPMGIQIDHVLGRKVSSIQLRPLPTIGSDHFPILADFVI